MSGITSHSRSVAVFDFDKTLIDGDVAYLFLNTAIKASKVRRMAVGMLMPVLLPFLLIRPGRIIVVSVMMWIATFPLRGKTAQAVFGAFASGGLSPSINARFYDEGMKALAAHRRLGHRLLIISGSPQELVRQVAQPVLERDIQIIGSRIVPFLGGLVYRSYCMGPEKIKLARKLGVLDKTWDYGYSDSIWDIPLLAHCRHRFLVNPDKKTIKRANAALGGRVTILNWTDTIKQPEGKEPMQIYDYLDTHGIDYERHDHPPVFTCDDVNRLVPALPGQKTKNLFICDNKGKQHFLVTVPDEKSVDLKSFGEALAVKKLRFASADRLQKHLALEPGAVTILGVMNDDTQQVQVIVDKAIWEADALQCHPLVNTATLVISLDNVRKFLDATGHEATVMDVPARF